MYYSAHAIFYFKVDNQESFLIQENVYLVKADDDQVAMDLAVSIATEDQDLNEDGHLELNDKKAQLVFAGIRKLIAFSAASENQVEPGVELTYSIMEVDTLSEVDALVRGEFVNVIYRE